MTSHLVATFHGNLFPATGNRRIGTEKASRKSPANLRFFVVDRTRRMKSNVLLLFTFRYRTIPSRLAFTPSRSGSIRWRIERGCADCFRIRSRRSRERIPSVKGRPEARHDLSAYVPFENFLLLFHPWRLRFRVASCSWMRYVGPKCTLDKSFGVFVPGSDGMFSNSWKKSLVTEKVDLFDGSCLPEKIAGKVLSHRIHVYHHVPHLSWINLWSTITISVETHAPSVLWT